MLSVLALGFLIGLQHAMEADHLAAVASLATRSRSLGQTARQGAVWGIGHTLTLFVFGGAVLVANSLIPERLAATLELAVGVMLILLGVDVLWRLWRQRIHFHTHRHGDRRHFHAHGHTLGSDHASDPHRHAHPAGGESGRFPLRALFVGMMHGLAGSAALIVLALQAVTSLWQGLAYIALFGMGSVIGMAALATIIALPLRWSARGLTWAHNGLHAAVGLFTIGLGAHIAYSAGIAGSVFG